MALDFPNSPTLGQVFTSGTKKWTWDGSYWNSSNITPNATTTTDGSMSSTDKTRLDDASGVNGIVKCNSLGNFSAAVAGTDYLTSASLSGSPATAKAYVDFWVADLGNPVQAYNISSITDIGTISLAGTTGTGLQVNFTTPMPTAKYSVFTGDYNGYCSLAADTGTIYVQPDGSQTANSFILFNAGSGRTRFRYRAIVFYNP
jgi:hypothetical protein